MGILGGLTSTVDLVKGGTDLVKFARGLNPMDPYNLTHPAMYLDHVNTVGAGLVHTANHPTELVSAIVGSGWGKDPAEAGGTTVFNLLSGVATGGGADAAVVGERVVLNSAESAAERGGINAGENAAERAAAGTAEHPGASAFDPVGAPARGRLFLSTWGAPSSTRSTCLSPIRRPPTRLSPSPSTRRRLLRSPPRSTSPLPHTRPSPSPYRPMSRPPHRSRRRSTRRSERTPMLRSRRCGT